MDDQTPKRSGGWWLGGAAAAALLVAVLTWTLWPGNLAETPAGPERVAGSRGAGGAEPTSPEGSGTALAAPGSESPSAKGVTSARPSTVPATSSALGGEASDALFANYGRTSPVPPDANPAVASVAEAVRTGSHPERLSVLVEPEPFDAAAYRADPRAYLDVAEPARAFQAAQPAEGVPVLAALTPALRTAVQGEAVTLRVRSVPNMPVTFTSFDLGQFENRLTTVTVEADAEGVAEASFTGTPGTIGDANILAASPAATGTVKFIVHVRMPPKGK